MTALAKHTEVTPASAERRRHGRVRVRLPGRFMRSDRKEFACMTQDISPGGVAFSAEGPVKPGERVVAYVEQIGRLEGLVVRDFDGGFAISMKLPAVKRERLADQLTWLATRHELGLPEDRRHERIRPHLSRTTLRLADGREMLATILDVSRSGVALALTQSAPVAEGAPVSVGATAGRIARIFAEGVAVEFSRVFPEEEFSADIQL